MKKIGVLLPLLLLCTLLTGCSQKLAEKEIVLVADAETLVNKEEEKEPVIQEFSHLKLLVIHDRVEEELIQELLNRDEISFQTKVAYGKDNISETITREKESLTDQMRHYRFQHTVTVLELLNACYNPEAKLLVPEIEIQDGEIEEKGVVVFKGGENRISFQ